MLEHSGCTHSVWMDAGGSPKSQAQSPKGLPLPMVLGEDVVTGICIIGAGVCGLSVAYELSRRGHGVVVLDDGPLVSGESERTTAHLSNALDEGYVVLERLHGLEGARLAAESHSAAIDLIEEVVSREEIGCGFERVEGYLWQSEDRRAKYEPRDESPSTTDQSPRVLEEELAATRRAGLVGVEWVERAPMGLFDSGPALRFPRQGQFHPVEYLAGLARCIVERGGRLFCHSHVVEVEDGSPCVVRTALGRTVRADAVVVATNSPVNDRVALHTKQAAYRTYVIAGSVPRGCVGRALFWDTAEPYHYVRLQDWRDEELLIVGGEDHKTGQGEHPERHWKNLLDWSRARFPMLGEIAYRWSGQVLEPVDGLGFVGRNPGDQHVYVVTGDSGHGMTHGTIAGTLLSDLITGKDHRWEALYSPARRTARAAGDFARENLNVAARYGEWVTPGDFHSEGEIMPGSGAVIRRGLRKVAVYKGEDGSMHECSAVCPHLGCIVHWNEGEKTWDCPCHGSRFDAFGAVLNGPANRGLKAEGVNE
jgi:glycine/D-amino acid oxidase-like deaminating enzyme/nitrite reductase/ring-hydroxylating ferredoxin subunit